MAQIRSEETNDQDAARAAFPGAGDTLEAGQVEYGTDERGAPLLRFKKRFSALNIADIAARAHYFAAMRAMPDADFLAGRGVTVEAMVRDDPRNPPRLIRYEFGIGPRSARTYAVMEDEAVRVVSAAHARFSGTQN